jgi:SOS response regulatory protein OraA/RecX
MPAEVVLAVGLGVGAELDRARARSLNRERRRHEAMTRAARALGWRDLSKQELDDRLARSRVAPADRSEAVDRLTHAGAIDDGRFAARRAELLADRGVGDELIRHDLVGRGVEKVLVEEAVGGLEPELMRACRLVEQRGASVKTARHLARKGFSRDAIEAACADAIAEDTPPAVR